MAQDIPVYLFTGFMDSGKTTLVEETLFENNFGDGSKGIIIMCEDGEKEYDEAKLATINFKLVTVEEEEDFTPAKLQEIQDTYQPEQIFIEYNGTWGMDKLLEAKMPEGWVIVQSLATVDSTTYDLYMNNMRAMMQEQVFPVMWLFLTVQMMIPIADICAVPLRTSTGKHRLSMSAGTERLMSVRRNYRLISIRM